MSIIHCSYCDKGIDTDYDMEHFIAGTEDCLMQVQDAATDLLKALKKITEMNYQTAEDKYENKNRAKQWACVKIAEEAIKKATNNYKIETKGVIEDSNGKIAIECYRDDKKHIIIMQPNPSSKREDRVFIRYENIKKLITILKKIKL